MAKMNFGGVIEEVMTREEFPLEKAREILKSEDQSHAPRELSCASVGL